MTGPQLREVILRGDLETLKKELPLEPTSIDYVGEEGCSLSFLAMRRGDFPMTKYLVEKGLRVNLSTLDSKGRDHLHHAAMSGSVDCCRFLVERGGMDPLRGDRELVTPFDIAHRMGHRELEAYFTSVVGADYEHLYRNPIRKGFFPDPSICRVGEDYYMVNSTFIFFPCIPISHSRDLVHWEVIGHAITNPDWAHVEGLEGGRGYWAPDISYCNGRFYITATLRLNDVGAVRRRQMVVTSDKPEGPYSEPVFFEEDGIDPSIFHDDDGRHYMLLNRGARIFEIDETATKRLSETTLLYYGSNKRAPEGPHLLKKDGWYYLFLAEGGTGMGHRETVARSRTIHGVYEPCPHNPIIRQWDEDALIQRCGHAKPVSTPDGRWYFVYLCGRALDGKWTMLGRETSLDPFTWNADGWPVLNGGKGVSDQNVMPLPAAPVAQSKTDWLTPRPPEKGQIAWNDGVLTLRGSAYPMTDTRCRSVLVQRQTSFRFRFSAVVTVPENGCAGVTCYYDEHSFFTLGVDNGVLKVNEQDGLEARCHDLGRTVQPGEKIELMVRADGLSRSLYVNGAKVLTLENVTYLADEGVSIGKRFTGAMTGVYAVKTTASFTDLAYQEEDEA